MLRPRDTAARERRPLTGLWRFRLDAAGEGRSAGWFRGPLPEDYQVAYLEMNHRVFDRIDAVVGEHVWNFADFATTSGIMRVGGNKKGVFTRDRQPKAAAWALRRRWRGEP